LLLHPEVVSAGDELIHLREVGSTMVEARERWRTGGSRRLWIVADRQTAGRGRQGRGWESPVGNLHLTVALPAPCFLRDQPKLGFVAGVALAEAVTSLAPAVEVRLKWPNDLLIGGAKCAGLLLEGLDGGAAIAIGMGVNIVAHPSDTPYPATDLVAASGEAISATDLLSPLSLALHHSIVAFGDGGGFPLVRSRWLARAAHLGQEITVRRDHDALRGRFLDIDVDGRLILDTQDGRVRIDAGDVFPLDKRGSAPQEER
jgi:BirA family transcriptional regulator, biotin operon repressor / biotin---[acetyl-CoA-carboxylase] ligase